VSHLHYNVYVKMVWNQVHISPMTQALINTMAYTPQTSGVNKIGVTVSYPNRFESNSSVASHNEQREDHNTWKQEKTRASWHIVPRSLGENRCFRDAYCLHHQGDPVTVCNTPLLQRDCTALYPRRLSSYSLPITWNVTKTRQDSGRQETSSKG
jgi:hypothetical protein